jgi:hypothetical protein
MLHPVLTFAERAHVPVEEASFGFVADLHLLKLGIAFSEFIT